MYTVYTISWASALLYDGCSLNQCHLLTPLTGQLTATAYSPIRWTRLDWGSFVTNEEIIENSQKT